MVLCLRRNRFIAQQRWLLNQRSKNWLGESLFLHHDWTGTGRRAFCLQSSSVKITASPSFNVQSRRSYAIQLQHGSNLVHKLHKGWYTDPQKVLFRIPGRPNDLVSMGERSKSSDSVPLLRKGYTTFEQFWQLVARYASCLRDAHGVRRGDRIVAQVSKSPENLALYFATLQIGAIYVPLNTAYTKAEVRYYVKDSQPKLMIAREEFTRISDGVVSDAKFHEHMYVESHHRSPSTSSNEELALELGGGTGQGDVKMTILSENDLFNDVWFHEERHRIASVRGSDTAVLCYTSGTTGGTGTTSGKPKGAQITHENMTSNCDALVNCWQMTRDDVLIHALPINHVHGLCVALNTALSVNAEVVLLSDFSLSTVLDYLPYATMMMGVPTYYTRLMTSERFTPTICGQMRAFISGSGPLSASVWQRFKELSGREIIERYGMTEAQMITSNPFDGPRVAGCVGYPLDGVQVRINEEDRMIEVKGPNVFSGYWKNQEKTAESFTEDGFFRTGDIGQWAGPDPDKPHLKIVGRASDMIISGGLNVYPVELETLIDNVSIAGEEIESAVIGVPHPDFGEAVVAVCAVSEHALNSLAEELDRGIQTVIHDNLANYKHLKKVILVPELPRSSMGKVEKKLLREQYKSLFI